MIDIIRRKLTQTDTSWDVNLEFKPEENVVPEHLDTATLPKRPLEEYPLRNPTTRDYYMGLVRSAIVRGGWYGDVQIPIPWLRMTLAGLESKRFDPEMMWNGVEEDELLQPNASEKPSYEKLFPTPKPVLREYWPKRAGTRTHQSQESRFKYG